MERTEDRIQQEIVQDFRNNYCLKFHEPQCIIFSVPNHGKDVVEQMAKKATGLLKGVSDLIIVIQGKVIFCEVKDLKGTQRPDQIKFEEKVRALGFEYWIVRSLEEFQGLVIAELGEK